jgi:hypothetical protein
MATDKRYTFCVYDADYDEIIVLAQYCKVETGGVLKFYNDDSEQGGELIVRMFAPSAWLEVQEVPVSEEQDEAPLQVIKQK